MLVDAERAPSVSALEGSTGPAWNARHEGCPFLRESHAASCDLDMERLAAKSGRTLRPRYSHAYGKAVAVSHHLPDEGHSPAGLDLERRLGPPSEAGEDSPSIRADPESLVRHNGLNRDVARVQALTDMGLQSRRRDRKTDIAR